MVDGREITVGLGGKRTAEALQQAFESEHLFIQLNTTSKFKVWINPAHVAAIEDRPDLDAEQ
jgi:hypothetical protein